MSRAADGRAEVKDKKNCTLSLHVALEPNISNAESVKNENPQCQKYFPTHSRSGGCTEVVAWIKSIFFFARLVQNVDPCPYPRVYPKPREAFKTP